MTAIDTNETLDAARKDSMAWLKATGRALQPVAKSSAHQIGRAAQPALNHVRKHPAPYALGALALGAGIGLLMSRTARNAVGEALTKSWNVASDSDLLRKVRH